MAEGNESFDGKINDKGIPNHTLGRYFGSNTPTIFDEIVSKSTDTPTADPANHNGSDNLEAMSGMSSGFFKNDDLFELDRSSDLSLPDYHRDAWIPSERTKNILTTIATSPPGSHLPNRENLTMPGLALQGDIADQTKEASIHFHGEEETIHRNVLTAGDVTQDERGLRNLIQAGCYRAAVNLSGRLLAIYGQGYGKISHPSKHTPHSLQLWYTRLSLLNKLRQFDVLKAESQPFGDLDKPDMYFSFHPELYGTRHGSMASFSFRLLLAEIPAVCGKFQEALDNLYKILSTVNRILKNLTNELSEEGAAMNFHEGEREDAMRLWSGRKSRILISIVNCAFLARNFVLAAEVLEDISESGDWKEEQLKILKLALGRLHLLLGDISAAEKSFISKDFAKVPPTTNELIDRGLMAVAQNAFQEAYNCFKQASAAEPSNIMLINNMAVCLLYTGKLQTAVQLLESSVMKNPLKNLQEPVILNMSTLYELHTTHCKQSKLQLLKQMNKYKGDATDIQCLKLAP